MKDWHPLLEFWFSDAARPFWFESTVEFDARLKRDFEPCLNAIDKCDHWRSTPEGRLALIILCDQIPRNIYRGSARAFAFDAISLDEARRFIGDGLDLALSEEERLFAYMPFEHSENPADQERCVGLFEENLGNAFYLDFAIKHKEIIDRFGCFPHRNQVLGRKSSPEEIAYLQGDDAPDFGQRNES